MLNLTNSSIGNRTLRQLRWRRSPAQIRLTLEAAAPLVAVMALSIGLGFLVAELILVGLTNGRRSVGWPDARYIGALTASAVLALTAVAAAISRLGKNTDLAAIRYE